MTTKLIAFRLSGELLDKAIQLYGEDQISEQAKKLLVESILGQLPDQPIPDPGDSKIGELEKAIAALTNRVDQLESNQIDLVNTQSKMFLPFMQNMNEKPKTNILLLKELVGSAIKDSPARVKAKFKKLTGIDADSLGENSYPDLMIKYIQDKYASINSNNN